MNVVGCSTQHRAWGPRCRKGYALLAVLWICAGVGALGIVLAATAREAMTASVNRITLTRAKWLAEGCVALARSELAGALATGTDRTYAARTPVWGRIEQTLAESPAISGSGCDLNARAVGSRLNVNMAEDTTMAKLLRGLGLPPGQADSLAAAIADWVDPDDEPRALGAERGWYEANDRPAPSNRPFRGLWELGLVRGMPDSFDLERVLDVEPGAISINHAPAEVLALLPGFTPEVARWVVARRVEAPYRAFADLSDGLPASDRARLAVALPRLVAVASLEPNAWILTVRAEAGRPVVTVVIELRMQRGVAGITVVRRRSWIL